MLTVDGVVSLARVAVLQPASAIATAAIGNTRNLIRMVPPLCAIDLLVISYFVHFRNIGTLDV